MEPEKVVHSSETSNTQSYSVFSSGMRIYLTYLLGLVMLLSTLTATIYFPLIPMLSAHFSVSIQAINMTITAYCIFQAASPLFIASLADAFGRRPVLLGLIALYSCASLGLALNRSSYAALLVLRSLQSIGGSATVSIAYGVVADVAVVSERGKMLGPLLSTCNAISAAGPVIGGAVALGSGGHAWVFLALLILSVVLLLATGFTLPETARNIVGNGAKPAHGLWRSWSSFLRRQNDQTDDSTVEFIDDREWKFLHIFTSLRIIFYPDAAAVLWMVAASYSVYSTFQTAIPVLFAELYDYNELELGLSLLPTLIGLTAGGIVAGKLVDRDYARTASKHGHGHSGEDSDIRLSFDFPIEVARYKSCLPFIIAEVALIVGYGWVVSSQAHPAALFTMQFFICFVSTVLTHTANALLVDIFPDFASTAYASGQVVRGGLSAASVAVLQPLVNAVGRGWYFTIFGIFVGGTSLIAVFISRTKGMQWRQKRGCAHGRQEDTNENGL